MTGDTEYSLLVCNKQGFSYANDYNFFTCCHVVGSIIPPASLILLFFKIHLFSLCKQLKEGKSYTESRFNNDPFLFLMSHNDFSFLFNVNWIYVIYYFN